MNKYTVVIPARMQSTRLADKMTLDLGGIPLIVRTATQARKSSANSVIVATDHKSILDICKEHGIDAVLTREEVCVILILLLGGRQLPLSKGKTDEEDLYKRRRLYRLPPLRGSLPVGALASDRPD